MKLDGWDLQLGNALNTRSLTQIGRNANYSIIRQLLLR
jgi:hypothetical protein